MHNRSKCQDRPNIILCTADQLRAFALGCYGNDFVRTPNIDSLAGGGVRFEKAVSTYPVCLPARSIMISGQYNRSCTGGIGNVCYGIGGRSFFPQYPETGRPHLRSRTLPEVLREHGYHNETIGKWHIHSWPHDVGFDRYLIPRVNHCHVGQSYTENGEEEFVPPGYIVDYEIGRVEELLKQRSDSDRPFFLYYNISPPHCPVSDAPERYLNMYAPEDVPLRPNVDFNRIQYMEHWLKVYRWDFRYYNHRLPYTENLDGYTMRNVIAEYYGLTTWVDDTIGRMLAALEANGMAENTIVIFTADHGDNLGSHGLVQKSTPNDESIRVPLIIRWPEGGLIDGRVENNQVAGLVDIAPTLLSLIGAPIPDHFQGRDVSAVARGEIDHIDESHAFIEMGHGLAARSPSRMLYIPYADRETHELAEAPTQFFDTEADPYQMNNLAGDFPDPAEQLESALRRFHNETPWMDVNV